MANIRPRKILAGVAGASFMQRPGIIKINRVCPVEPLKSVQRRVVASQTGGDDAIEEIYPPLYSIYQVLRHANAHQVTWFIFRQNWIDDFQHGMHLCLGFTDGKTADGIPRKI